MTALEARRVERTKGMAGDLGLRLQIAVDAIHIEVSDHRKYKGFVKNARLASVSTVEEAAGWLSGFAHGWTYCGLKSGR